MHLPIHVSQADARLIRMPIYTSDGVLIGRVTNVDVAGSSRSLTAAVGGVMAFGPRQIWIPVTWTNKEQDYTHLLMTGAQIEALVFPGRGIGSRRSLRRVAKAPRRKQFQKMSLEPHCRL